VTSLNQKEHLDIDEQIIRIEKMVFEMGKINAETRKGVSQGAYAQLEAKKRIRKASRVKIATALGIQESQLDF
jgi:hypothetical protein